MRGLRTTGSACHAVLPLSLACIYAHTFLSLSQRLPYKLQIVVRPTCLRRRKAAVSSPAAAAAATAYRAMLVLKLSMFLQIFDIFSGSQRLTAVEYVHIPWLSWCLPAGAKVAVQDAAVRRGLLLLTPQTAILLGGQVGGLWSGAWVGGEGIERRPLQKRDS